MKLEDVEFGLDAAPVGTQAVLHRGNRAESLSTGPTESQASVLGSDGLRTRT